jgi:hypothetical protein
LTVKGSGPLTQCGVARLDDGRQRPGGEDVFHKFAYLFCGEGGPGRGVGHDESLLNTGALPRLG